MNQQWKPIESVPDNNGRPMFCLLAFGPEGDQSVGQGFRVNGKWYVGATFYCLGQEKRYEIREIEVQPTHWQPRPAVPCLTCNGQGAVGNVLTAEPCPDCTPPASAQDDAKDERQADACPRCDGSGEITVASDNSPDAHDVVVCCDHCQGSGAAVDAAKFLASVLSGEKYRHMQLWAEYRNFHRSLCARFGYGHDEIHFRRDLVSLEEAIAAKVAAPAAGDARDAARLDWLEKKVVSKGMHGLSFDFARHVEDGQVLERGVRIMWRHHLGERHPTIRAAIDEAIAASQQQGDA